MKLLTIVTVSVASGLTNAYRSVLSACGSAAINGASRCLDAPPGVGPSPTNTPIAAAAATAVTATRRLVVLNGATVPSSFFRWVRWTSAALGRPRVRPIDPPFARDARGVHPRFAVPAQADHSDRDAPRPVEGRCGGTAQTP